MGLATPRRYGTCRVSNEQSDLAAGEVRLTTGRSGRRYATPLMPGPTILILCSGTGAPTGRVASS